MAEGPYLEGLQGGQALSAIQEYVDLYKLLSL